MENLESNEIKAESIVEQPILIFGVPLRFQNPKLTLREFSRFVACIAAALTIISCLLAYMTRRDGYVDVQIGLTTWIGVYKFNFQWLGRTKGEILVRYKDHGSTRVRYHSNITSIVDNTAIIYSYECGSGH
jgi:hypothetical protein